ncbi:MAG: hypothetical protein KA204_00040 [Chromatiaceae bacterium]|nr:hypothetical protein [Chromatiaceae bacterium]
MKYTLLDVSGHAVGGGDCQEIDLVHIAAPVGGSVITGHAPPHDFLRLWRWNGQTFVDDGPRFPTTYVTQRLENYPSPGEQLDALWHAMDDGATPKIEPWYSSIKAIKDAYPKP